jgi:hypothetical protein
MIIIFDHLSSPTSLARCSCLRSFLGGVTLHEKIFNLICNFDFDFDFDFFFFAFCVLFQIPFIQLNRHFNGRLLTTWLQTIPLAVVSSVIIFTSSTDTIDMAHLVAALVLAVFAYSFSSAALSVFHDPSGWRFTGTLLHESSQLLLRVLVVSAAITVDEEQWGQIVLGTCFALNIIIGVFRTSTGFVSAVFLALFLSPLNMFASFSNAFNIPQENRSPVRSWAFLIIRFLESAACAAVYLQYGNFRVTVPEWLNDETHFLSVCVALLLISALSFVLVISSDDDAAYQMHHDEQCGFELPEKSDINVIVTSSQNTTSAAAPLPPAHHRPNNPPAIPALPVMAAQPTPHIFPAGYSQPAPAHAPSVIIPTPVLTPTPAPSSSVVAAVAAPPAKPPRLCVIRQDRKEEDRVPYNNGPEKSGPDNWPAKTYISLVLPPGTTSLAHVQAVAFAADQGWGQEKESYVEIALKDFNGRTKAAVVISKVLHEFQRYSIRLEKGSPICDEAKAGDTIAVRIVSTPWQGWNCRCQEATLEAGALVV